VLWRILDPKRYKIIGGWINLHDEELHNLYASANIIIMIKPRKIRWLGHVAHMGARRGLRTGLWYENQKEREN
jgi:hypothetical protein